MRKYFPGVMDFYQAAWKIHQSFGGNFKPWRSVDFIKKQFNFKSKSGATSSTAILMQNNFNCVKKQQIDVILAS